MTKVSELFAAPRGNLKIVAKLFGEPVYSSSDLKLDYLRSLGKTSRIRPIFRKVTQLVKEGQIVPAYTTKSFFKSIIKKRPLNLKNTAGMTVADGKIYIFVETDSNIFSFTSNNEIAIITLHELTHLCSDRKSKMFLNTFSKDFQDFYLFYFSMLLSLDQKKVDNKKIKDLVSFIYQSERKFWLNNQQLEQYYNLISDTFRGASTLNDEIFRQLQTDYIVSLKLIQKFMSLDQAQYISKVTEHYKHIYSPFYSAYKAVFTIDPLRERYLCYQEQWIPSEIVSVTAISKNPNPKIFKLINSL